MSGSSTLPIQRLVNVTVTLTPQAPQAENIDTLVIVGTSNVIDSTQRMRSYSTIEEVAADFGTAAPEYLAAVLWYEQNPAPNQLFIGRWVNASAAGELVGAPTPSLTPAQLTGITTGGFFVTINGVPYSVSGLSFAGVSNLNGAAAIVQTALQGLLASTTFVYNSTYDTFTLTSPTTGAASSVSFGQAPTANGSITFTGQPTNLDTVTVNGTVVTFVTGAPTGNQVTIGGTQILTAAALLAFLQASPDVNISKLNFTSNGASIVYCVSKLVGTPGNAYTLTKSSTNITVSGATLTGGTGTDVSALFGLTNAPASGSYLVAGQVAETALAAVVALDTQFSNQWYAITVLGAADTDVLSIAAYIEASTATRHFYGVTTQETGVLTTGNTGNIAYQLQQLKYNKTACQYSSQNPYAIVSLLARILTTNWTANNSTITLMYKQEPGIVAEALTTTQVNALEGYSCNVFVAYNNNTAIIERGTCASGQFIDTIIGMDWFALTLQNNWYTALYDSPTKIPQTDPGMHILATVAENTCIEGVTNGLFAPGVWNSGGFGQLSQGDYLPKGYYVYQPSVDTQTESVRATRVSVPFQIAVKLAGAVQTVDGSVLVNV